jgi:hypothetical protein
LSVRGDARGLVGHAGAVLLRKCADQAGLTGALGTVFARLECSPVWDRGVVLVNLAVAIVLGATSMRQITLLAHQALVFGDPPSDSTVRRALEPIGADPALLVRIAKARAKVRAHVWKLIEATETGFPWLRVAGKVLTGWIVIDIDATIVLAHSDKEGASATFKKTWGFHPQWSHFLVVSTSCSASRGNRARAPAGAAVMVNQRPWGRCRVHSVVAALLTAGVFLAGTVRRVVGSFRRARRRRAPSRCAGSRRTRRR